ncbi:uncharacterized protein stbd1 [Myripristis murdjan]|uniref:uncharacterized protein stbd1 n=1 Tax=Myripristis murdjan TaxID=586833 RepID=UPI0011760645|nr:starch-binding domain-containing protein 1 [Myripristis murdjan]
MTVKNSKPVALDRRYDLASLFCMIGRHGPAVAMAILAMVSVLAAFIIYRTVRRKRRKPTAAESDSKTAGAEKDAAGIQSGPEPSRGDTHGSVESTEEGDGPSPDLLEEDADLIQDHLGTEESCAAAAAADVDVEDSYTVLEAVEKKPPLCSPPKTENETPTYENIKKDDLVETEATIQSPECDINTFSAPEMYSEEVNQTSQCDADNELQIEEVEDVVECHLDPMDNTEDESVNNVEKSHDNESCLKEPESIDYESCQEEETEKVYEAEYEEVAESACPGEDMTTDMKSGQDDEDFQCAVKELLSQTPCISEDGDDDKLPENEMRQGGGDLQSDLKELVACIPEVKDEECKEENYCADSIDSNYCSDANLPVKEENKGEIKDEEECAECVDYQLMGQQAEAWDTVAEQEMNLPVSELPSIHQQQLNEQRDQCEHVTDKVTLISWDSVEDVGGGLAGQVIEEDISEDIDHLNECPAVAYDPNLPCLNEQQPQIEQKDENHHPTCDPEECVLPTVADQLKEETVANADVSDHRDNSSMVLSPLLPTSHLPGEQDKDEKGDDGPAGVITDAEGHMASVAYYPHVSSSCEQPQSEQKETEDETAPSVDEDAHMNIHDPVLPSCDSEIQWEKSNSGTLRALAEDGNAPVCDPCLQSLHQDQENDHVVNKKAFDKADISANPDMVACDGENIIAPVVAEEMSGPPLSSVYQDQENDHVVNNEADEKASIPAGTDAAACDVENITAHVMAEEMPAPPMPSFYQGQQNDHIGNNETLEEAKVAGGPIVAACNVENSTAPVLTEEMPDPPLLSCCQDQENDHVVNHEAFERASISAGTDAVACDAENISVPVMAEEIPSPHLTCYQGQQNDHIGNNETLDEGGVASCPVVAACDVESIGAPVMTEEMSGPPLSLFYQDQHSDHMVNNETLKEAGVAAGPDVNSIAAPVMAEDSDPPLYHLDLPSLKQSEQKVNDDGSVLSPSVDDESGISSMTFSPDLHSPPFFKEVDDDYTTLSAPSTVEDPGLPVLGFDPCLTSCHQPVETHYSQYIHDDMSKSHSITGMVFGPFPTPVYQQRHSERTDQAICKSFAGNDDMLGQVIEDNYNKEIDNFSEKIAITITNFCDDLKKQTEVKDLVEMKEKKERGGDKKEGMHAEDEKEEDFEKTEISIMEATMDNNEWITDGNYQVLPWMSFSLPSFPQNQTKTDQLPTEEHQHDDSTVPVTETAAASVETTTTDITPSTDAKESSALSLIDENIENNKKVVAVQPMPQNVNVTFCVHYLTHSPSQKVAVTGNQQELGSWKEFIPLERAKDGYWASVISLPAESHVEWKFVLLDEGEVCRWEECDNRLLDTGYGDDLHVHKWWGFL